MSKAEVKWVEMQLEIAQKQVDGAVYLKRTYAERKRSLVTRIAECQRDLDNLEKSHSTVDADLAKAEADVLRLKEELLVARYGDKIEAVRKIQEQLRKMGKRV